MFPIKTNISPILFRKNNNKFIPFSISTINKNEKKIKIVPKTFQKGVFKREV